MDISEGLQETIISFLEGNLTHGQIDELITWLEEDKQNLTCFREIEKAWFVSHLKHGQPDTDKGLKALRDKIKERDIRRIPSKEIGISVPALVNIAAGILLIVGLSLGGAIYIIKKNNKEIPVASVIETSAPRGSRSFIMLPDSTGIWLNSDTKLKYYTDYGITSRAVFLEGEAYFKVKKNADLPFVVNADVIKVTALGTAFNVKAYKEEATIETTLEEGQVSIALLNNEIKDKKPGDVLILEPKQTAVYQKQDGVVNSNNQADVIEKVSTAPSKTVIPGVLPLVIKEVSDTRLFTSWKDPKWIFRNERLGSLVPKLERRYNVTIHIIDKQVEEYPFTGILLEESIEQVLSVIQLTSPIKYEINSQEVKISEDKLLRRQYEKIFRNH